MSKTRHFSREAWVNACRFHEVSGSEVLTQVAHRISEASRPLVLLDLDSTLYEVQPRTRQILHEWSQSSESRSFELTCSAMIKGLPNARLGYSIQDSLVELGLDLAHPEVQESLPAIKDFWRKRFFSSRYLPYDRAYPGAAGFTCRLHEMGAEIIYLTGRDEPGMGEGTRSNLIRDGFPWNHARTHLLLKATPSEPDLEHKKNAAEFIRSRGSLIASFENEPVNLAALYEIFPEAMHVFVDTVCSEHPAVPCQGLYRIAGFE